MAHSNIPWHNTDDPVIYTYPKHHCPLTPHQTLDARLLACGADKLHPWKSRHGEQPNYYNSSPSLARFNLKLNKADVVDEFFKWHSIISPSKDPSKPNMEAKGYLMVVTRLEDLPVSHFGVSENDRQLVFVPEKGPVYFVQDSTYYDNFERVGYGKNWDWQADSFEKVNTTLLKCIEHGVCWEVNVLALRESGFQTEKHVLRELDGRVGANEGDADW